MCYHTSSMGVTIHVFLQQPAFVLHEAGASDRQLVTALAAMNNFHIKDAFDARASWKIYSEIYFNRRHLYAGDLKPFSL